MPAKISNEKRREIVRLRALDYTKQEIAEKVGVSRNTVSRHLSDVREEIEDSEFPSLALADFFFVPEELLQQTVRGSGDAFAGLLGPNQDGAEVEQTE